MKSALFVSSAKETAPALLGSELHVTASDGHRTGGIIVETEAYDQTDEASHSYRGRTKRTGPMFAAPGTVYVYLTYGMHLCMNLSVGDEDFGAAVLLRAIEPTVGIETMWQRRFGRPIPVDYSQKQLSQLTNGPAKLTQALGITLDDNYIVVNENTRITVAPPDKKPDTLRIVQTPRIGISKAVDKPWRWYVADNAWVSRR